MADGGSRILLNILLFLSESGNLLWQWHTGCVTYFDYYFDLLWHHKNDFSILDSTQVIRKCPYLFAKHYQSHIIVDTRLSFFFLSSVAHLLCSSSLNTEKCIGKACNGIHEILLQSSPSPRSNAAGKNQRWAYNESPYFQSIVELLRALRSNIFPINILGTCMAFKKFQASSSTFLTKSIRHKSLPNVYVSNSCVEIIGILEEVCMWKVSKSHYLVK